MINYIHIEKWVQRIKDEYHYYTQKSWTLEDVGDFWDTVIGYDDINKGIYPYYRRFTNSYELAKGYLNRHAYRMLDIQSRSGHGTLFWNEKKKIKHSTCVDFSDYLLGLADRRLQKSGLDYELLKIKEFPLPFKDQTFDLVCTYETIEHISDYRFFLRELMRVMTDDGIMILTCPSRAWNWVHILSAVMGINHSEGPHRFLSRRSLLKSFDQLGLSVLEENSTILLPFNHRISIKLDAFLEKMLARAIKRRLALRRTFILKKTQTEAIDFRVNNIITI